ncbi:hypothetical protein M9Y10_002613 [Tritrichomonas musculus]|uniref:Uncharacterized protein n=1 Tax=Tritrichomonas musculus TaxID=1915356 RepID=A0ABR2LCN1_9EUKA
MSEYKVQTENGQTTITASPYLIDALKQTFRKIIGCEEKYALSSFEFKDKKTEIEPQILNALMMLYPEMRIDLLEEAEKLPLPTNFPHHPPTKRIPIAAASFLIEAFARNQSASVKCQVEKDYESNPIYVLYIPIPIPIKFKRVSEKEVELSFSDSPIISNQVQISLIENAIKSIFIRKIAVASFKDVDLEGFENDIQESMGETLKAYLLKSRNEINGDARSFKIYIMPKNQFAQSIDDVDYLRQIRNRLEKKFFLIERRRCQGCDMVYSDISNEPLRKYLSSEDYIPFEDGKSEHVQLDEYGNEVIMVNTRNGPIEKGYGDDIEVEVCNHQGEPSTSLSKLEFEIEDASNL